MERTHRLLICREHLESAEQALLEAGVIGPGRADALLHGLQSMACKLEVEIAEGRAKLRASQK